MFEDVGYPFGTVVVNNTPERLEKALRWLARLTEDGETGGMITLACWNEWTEGAYMAPDTQYGYECLEAIRNVFGRADVDESP